MDSRKFIIKETIVLAIGQALCVALMLAVFALLMVIATEYTLSPEFT